MSDILNSLEPWYSKKAVIFGELDEFGMVVFVNKGTVGLGYEINKICNLCLMYENNCIIGSYGLTFN